MESLLIKKIAEKYGIPETEALELFDSLKKEDNEFKKLLADLSDGIKVMTELPEEGKKALIPVIQSHILNQMNNSDDLSDFVKKIAAYTAILKSITKEDDDEMKELKMEIEELKKTFENLGKQVEDEERERLWQEIQELKRAILEAKKKREEEGKDEIDQLEKLLTKIETTKEKLKRLGLLKESNEEDIDVQRAEEILRRMGYKVEKPPDWHRVQKIIQEELEKKEEEIRKKLEEELKMEEKKMSMAMDLALALIGGVMGTIGGKKHGAVDKFVEGLKKLMGGGAGESGEGSG